jgi:hypothetical protein
MMSQGDLVIARSMHELELLERSETAVRSLRSLDQHVRAQVAVTAVAGHAIVASVEALDATERRNGFVLGEINAGLGLVSNTLLDGFSQLAYQQRLQSDLLKGILETLQSPSAAQAREFRSRGLYAYRNGWIEEADSELGLALERDPFDFTVHQVMGDIRLRCTDDPVGAARHFALAAKYAVPVSSVDAAYAQMSLSRSLEATGDLQGSKSAALEATQLAPDLSEAHYLAGRVSALAGDLGAAAGELAVAIRLKPELALLALNESAFAAHSEWLGSVLDARRDALLARVSALSRAFDETFRRIGTALERYLGLHEELEHAAAVERRLAALDDWFMEDEVPDVPDEVELTAILSNISAIPARIRAVRSEWQSAIQRNTILDLHQAISAFDSASGELAEAVLREAAAQSAIEPYPASNGLLKEAIATAGEWRRRFDDSASAEFSA